MYLIPSGTESVPPTCVQTFARHSSLKATMGAYRAMFSALTTAAGPLDWISGDLFARPEQATRGQRPNGEPSLS
jgi:hypothetical protein